MNTKRNIWLIVGGIIVIAIAAILIAVTGTKTQQNPQQTPAERENPIATAFYSCNQGKTIQAAFYKGGPQPSPTPGQPPIPTGSVDVRLSDGRILTLKQTISADGTRYANADESFVFWSKGNGALVLENTQQQSYIGCVLVTPQPSGSDLTKIYSSGTDGFSIRIPEGYAIDESYKYQLNPAKVIGGVKFTIPESVSTGTNLGSDTYISIEFIPQTRNCTASLFLDGTHPATEKKEGNTTYSFAQSSGAGAGNRYEETVYAIPGTNPCVAVRYLIHYGVFQNYPPGAVRQFDQQALMNEFDQIRRTLVINQ